MKDKFLIKVFFRGDWCPWCNAYLKDFDSHIETIRGLGGEVLAITSQEGNQTKENNGLSFDVLVDNDNREARKYEIVVTPQKDVPNHDAIDSYVHGMIQPGVLIEDSKGRILFRWAIDPNEMNFSGAKDRPLVSDIVKNLEDLLSGKTNSNHSFGAGDMDYLQKYHPEEFKTVQAYLASTGK